jgi:hypothetical protein
MRSYIIRMAIISLVPSIMVSILVSVSGMFPEDASPPFPVRNFESAVASIPILVILCPIVETLLMSFGLKLISLFTKKQVILAVLSAILWALLHSLVSPAWGLVVFWPFFVFSSAYIAWRRKSWLKAFWVAACIHALQNLLPSIALVILLGS